MRNRILETEMNNLRRKNSELLDDITRIRKTNANQRADLAEYVGNDELSVVTQERESLIAQLEQKNIEVSILCLFIF